jgi:hypothetical protein
MRWFLAMFVGVVIATALPIGSMNANAAKEKSKSCTATAMDSKKVSWKCKASEKCCFDFITSKGTCVASSAICL